MNVIKIPAFIHLVFLDHSWIMLTMGNGSRTGGEKGIALLHIKS